jgi:YHS domain-containing protein
MSMPPLPTRRYLVIGALVAISLGLAGLTTAGQVLAAQPTLFTGLVKGVAVGGYDPVAYFTERRPVKGSPEFTLEHEGATWRFASAANRDAFKADPAKYAPQYGGYCAWAVASGYTAKGDPEAWTVSGGKLYLNYNQSVRRGWEQDILGNVKKGDANWPRVLEK